MEETEGYLVPASTARVMTTVVNSKFITAAGRIENVEDAKAFIQAIREEFSDANHHVYAFRVGHGGSVIDGMSDDGEPSGTSGPPVLAVLRGSGIGDIVIVVTRYFGGTKLGTGGLTRAYSEAARTVLAALPLERKIQWSHLAFDLPYSLYELVSRMFPTFDASVEDEQFAGQISMFIRLPSSQVAAFTHALIDLSSGTVTPIDLDSD